MKIQDKTKEIIAYFITRKESYMSKFSPDRLFEKLRKGSRKAGSKVVYMVLVLYYALLGKEVSLKDKAMVIAALGYFIAPFDFLPDMLGMIGFTDDFAVLGYVFKKVYSRLTPEVKEKARIKVEELFPEEKDKVME